MHTIRRKERAITEAEAFAVLKGCEYAVLATIDKSGDPYCIPVSPVLMDKKIYFHCAPEGEKLDNILRHPRVCLTCVGDTELVPEQFTTLYESAVVRGRAEIVTDEMEKVSALQCLCMKYASQNLDAMGAAIERSLARTGIVCITIDEITGKAKRRK